MAGISKALEFPSDVVFQRVIDGQEASADGRKGSC